MPGHEAIAATFVEPRGMIRSIVAGVVSGEGLGGSALATVAAAAAPGTGAPGTGGPGTGGPGTGAPGTGGPGTGGPSPLRSGQIAYLSVSDDQLVLFQAKRGAFRPKPTDEAIASAPRSTVRSATLEKGRIAGVLEISFAGGSNWAFDIPKVHLAGAQQVAAALTPFGHS